MSAPDLGPRPAPDERDVLAYLRAHPGVAPDVRDAIIWSGHNNQAPFRWSDPPISGRILDRLVLDRLLVKVDAGRYRFRDFDAALRGYALWLAEVQQRAAAIEAARYTTESTAAPPPGAPGDMFSEIIGYDSVKRVVFMAMSATEPVHILFEGPPASAKSLFLEGLSTLPGSVYRFGDAVSRAGIRRLLMDEKPPFLIVDEIDKMSSDDDTALLEFMERQRVSLTVTGINRDEAVNVRVFAAANKINRMRPELLSRFHRIKLKDYTVDEFRAVARAFLKKRGLPADLAQVIADGVTMKTRDIRDCRRVANMARSVEDARFLIDGLGREASV